MKKDNPGKNYAGHSRKESYYGVGSFIVEVVKVFLWALVIIVPIRVFLFQPFFVQGASMETSFEDGEYLIINELGYKKTDVGFDKIHFFSIRPFKELKRGDVIVFRYPKNHQQYFIKRVIGLPGEKIAIENGEVLIYNARNPGGSILDESEYLASGVKTAGSVVLQLGGDEYFVLGDNRSSSHDSRSWGPLKSDEVIGKVILRAWPLEKASVF
ncbi:MAG: signal peptidase I [Candidatus Moranbacteria bacterium]|nr:signal peptidase I [Candidatus Moranbacteria bacterium]